MIYFLVWYLWTQSFALAGAAITRHWLGGLPDRGYGASKATGLILGSFAYWWAITLGLAANDSGGALLALAAVAAVGLMMNRRGKLQLPRRLRDVPDYVWWTEAIFLAALAVCALFRSYVPDITEAGGEKYMEVMFLNAILRSPTFPPNDAWLAGLPISYYYFGYVLQAMLTRISGVAPAIAFNLSGALFFALAIVTAFSAGFNLFGLRMRTALGGPTSMFAARDRRALAAGLLTATMLGLMGNLGGFMGVLRCNNVLPAGFWQWLDVRQIATRPTDYCQNGIPRGFFYSWWWDWSRVVKDISPGSPLQAPQLQEVITESPVFSYILGDNHPHVMSLPFTLLAVLIAMTYLATPAIRNTLEVEFGKRAASGAPRFRLEFPAGQLPEIFLTAIVAGGLAFMNTWDFPVFGSLIALGLIAGRALRGESLGPSIIFGAAVFALGYVLYLPFYATFASQAKGITVNLFNGTKFHQFFLIFAPFLLAAPGLIAAVAEDWAVGRRMLVLRALRLGLLSIVGALLLAALFGLLSPQARALMMELQTTGKALGVPASLVQQRLTQRINPFDPNVAGPWTPIILIGLAATCAVVLWQVVGPAVRREKAAPGGLFGAPAISGLFALVLFLAGALITASVEFVYLLDNFGTRMNTVFKFYYQGWTMWSVAAGFAIVLLLGHPKRHLRIAGSVALVFVGLGLLWPVFAAPSRTDNFTRLPTLDGAAYLKPSNPDDARLIDWINSNVRGDPIIVEAPGKNYASYVYAGRISTFTGLPTLLGWGGHENQWRGSYAGPAAREPQIEKLFTLVGDDAQARAILRQYDIEYVVVGDLERQTYPAPGLAKFDTLCAIAFRSGTSTLYACK